MTDYPAHHTPDLTSQNDLAALSADAANWRTLLTELTIRGFAEMSLSDILACFPDLQKLAHAHSGANPPDAVAAAKCAFLDTLRDTDSLPFGATITLRLDPVHPGAIIASRRTKPPVDVREFAEADTALGMVNVGYTDEVQMAFTFADTNDTYLLPVLDILSELISAIVARRPIWSQPQMPAMLM